MLWFGRLVLSGGLPVTGDRYRELCELCEQLVFVTGLLADTEIRVAETRYRTEKLDSAPFELSEAVWLLNRDVAQYRVELETIRYRIQGLMNLTDI
jgi:hypothetical protein